MKLWKELVICYPTNGSDPCHLKVGLQKACDIHLKPFEGFFEAGYIAIDNQSLVVIRTCPIFNQPNDTIMEQIQELVHRLPNPDNIEGRLTVLKTHQDRYILFFQFRQAFKIEPSFFNQILQHIPGFAGILLTTSEKQVIFGDIFSEQTFEGLTFRFTPQAFIQNHPDQSANIYQHIVL